MKMAAFLLLGLLFMVGCESLEPSVEPEPSPETSKPKPAGTEDTHLLQLVNQLRASGCTCGTAKMPPVSAVALSTPLNAAALAHSNDMVSKQFFSHKGSDGSDAGLRIQRAGFNWTAYGENIAAGYTTVESVFDGWKNSPGHCKNMMGANYKFMGMGRVNRHWTQVFAR